MPITALRSTDPSFDDPIQSTNQALHTIEQGMVGYDPSTGRVPVEQANTGFYTVLTNSTYTAQVKAAPGFVKGITITPFGTLTATHVAIYDSTTASGTLIDVIKIPASETEWIDEDTLATTGIYVALCTVNATTGVVTNAAAGASGCVGVSVAYR